MTESEVRELLRGRVAAAGSQAAFAREYKIDRSTLSLVLGSGKREHGITPQILAALGLKRVVSYEPG